MINNRQSSRRRGRGGSSQQRPSSGSSGQRDSGNRIDSRARGNAAQLLEKYKNMARDAQMSGDRVQVEYYLQFADHYFRVLSDSRARSDDHRPIRPVDDFDGSDEEYGDEGEPIRSNDQGADYRQQPQQQNTQREPQQPRRDDPRRDDGRYEESRRDDGRRDDGRRDESRGDDGRGRDDARRDERPTRSYAAREDARADRAPREDRAPEQPAPQANGHTYRERVANDRDVTAPAADAEPRPSSTRRPSRSRSKPATLEAAEGMDADRLPPALGVAAKPEEQPIDAAETAVEGEPKPKRRRRSPSASTEAQTG